MKKQQRLWRGFLYGAGLLVLTCGITLNTKTLLGVSPVISVPNCLSLLYGWKLGWLVTVLYLGCVLIQIPLKGRRFGALDLMQFPVSVLCGWLVGLYDTWLNFPRLGLSLRLGLLAAAILLTGAGVCLTVDMELAPNPMDGLVSSLSQATGRSLGLCKNLLDVTCVGVTAALGLLLGGQVLGVGVGTLASMLLTGRVIAGINRAFRQPMRRLAGLEPAGTGEPSAL